MAEKSSIGGLIVAGTRFEGKLLFNDKMRIEGELIGEIVSKDQLIVGKSAKIDAKIDVGELIVMGEVRGNITSCDLLRIQDGGRVLADINVKKLDIQHGAIFEGHCTMIREKKSQTAIAGT